MKTKFLFTALFLTGVLALTACGGNDTAPTGEVANDGVMQVGGDDVGVEANIVLPPRDLGGMEINIVNWWSDSCTDTADPQSAAERAMWDNRREMEERYNFRMRYYRFGSWGDVRDFVQPEILAQSRNYHFWTLEPSWFATHNAQRLFAPIPMEHFEDDYGIEWVRTVLDLTSTDGTPHGFAIGTAFLGGVYFNQRLFSEAGLDYDLPFTLQREGNWTWETFTDAARRLSRDLTGDGIIDTWAITSFSADLLFGAMANNGATFVEICPDTGLFVSTTNSINFFEAIEWTSQLRQEMLLFHGLIDHDAAWDAFVQMFNDGHGAMRVAGHYVAGNLLLEDPWGFVSFPRGPRGQPSQHVGWVSHNIRVIPHFFTPEEVDDFMFAMRMWARPVEGDASDEWIFENYVNHPDTRSVDETMVNFTRNPDMHIMPVHNMLPGLGEYLGPLFHWRIGWGAEAAGVVEEGSLAFQAFLDRVNAM